MAREVLEMSRLVSENSKNVLEKLTIREPGEKRDAWFSRMSRAIGIPASRLKSLYYDPRVKMWASELELIQRKHGVLLQQQLDDLTRRQAVIRERLLSLGGAHERNSTIAGQGRLS